MNENTVVDLVSWDTQITASISNDDLVSNGFPLSTGVELLIQMAIRPESSDSDLSTNHRIAETSEKTVTQDQFAVC